MHATIDAGQRRATRTAIVPSSSREILSSSTPSIFDAIVDVFSEVTTVSIGTLEHDLFSL